jgi:tRNA (cmo5U34)-methyltransferase
MTDTVNLWTGATHANAYLERRDEIPHRGEGYAVLLEFLPPESRRVLDLGTGDGLLLSMVCNACPGVEGVAVDFSATMLDAARTRFGDEPEVTLLEHDLDAPLPALGTFDAVVSSFAIHHVVDARKRSLYREIHELLAPGGVFCNLEHVASPTAGLHEDFLVAIGRTIDDDDPSNKLAPVETQLGWLRDIGFVDVDCQWKWRELALFVANKPA